MFYDKQKPPSMSSTNRKRSKSNEKLQKSNRGDKIICIPVDSKSYEVLCEDTVKFRAKISELIVLYPELFPATIREGYEFHDKRTSKKQSFTHRRILLRDENKYYFNIQY